MRTVFVTDLNGTYDELHPIYECIKKVTGYTCTIQKELYREEYWFETMPDPMFQNADQRYAVANAVPELKELADAVIGTICEDSALFCHIHLYEEKVFHRYLNFIDEFVLFRYN